MDFTREPIVETVITPKEGCKLVVRSSKTTGQEEYFVDSLEVVAFGNALFYRSLERPKAFLVPVSDYEILEVREARMVLKNVGLDRSIKIGGGREGQMRGAREVQEKVEVQTTSEEAPAEETVEAKTEARPDKKRERRRHYRRRRGRDEPAKEGTPEEGMEASEGEGAQKIELAEPRQIEEEAGDYSVAQAMGSTTSILTSLLPPPPTLISETIARYKDNVLFKGAFYLRDENQQEEQGEQEGEETPKIPLEQPEYGSFSMSEDEEDQIFRERKTHFEDDLPENGEIEAPEPLPENNKDEPKEVSNGNPFP